VSVYERLEALNIGRCGVDASQPRNFSIGVCYLKSVCGRRIGRLLDTLRMLELRAGRQIPIGADDGQSRSNPRHGPKPFVPSKGFTPINWNKSRTNWEQTTKEHP